MITKEQIDQAFINPENFIYLGDLPIGDTWSIGPTIQHRDSTLIDQSNAIALKEELKEHSEWNDDWAIESMNHWAVGWVEKLCFRVVNKDGSPSEIFQFLLDWKQDLEDYPLADEELYSRMEYEATLENIGWVGSPYLKEDYPDDWAEQVWAWFWDNNQRAIDNVDDEGGWPSREEMQEVLKALNLLEEE